MERFEGGVLGLLLLNTISEPDDDDNKAKRMDLVRLASTFFQAAGANRKTRAPHRLGPLVKLPVVHARKQLTAPLSDLGQRHLELLDASDSCDVKEKKEAGTTHQPLPELLDAVDKVRNHRGLSFSIVKDRERALLGSRFLSVDADADALATSGRASISMKTKSIIQACPWEGSLSLGELRPPTGVLLRVEPGEARRLPASAEGALIGRPAWRRALRDVRMPKFGENKVSLSELLRETAAPMSYGIEAQGLAKKGLPDILASVADSVSGITSVRHFLRFLSVGPVPAIDAETWTALAEWISKSVESKAKTTPSDAPSPGETARSWIPPVLLPDDDSNNRTYLASLTELKAPTKAATGVRDEKNESGIKAGGAPPLKPPTDCDLEPIPERPLASWTRDPSPEPPGPPPPPTEIGLVALHEMHSRFWDSYRGALSTAGGGKAQVGASQGHLHLASPVLMHRPDGADGGGAVGVLGIPIYDHVRAVEPRGVCRSFYAKGLQELSANEAKAFVSRLAEEKEDAEQVVGMSRAWNELLKQRQRRTQTSVRATGHVIYDSLEDRDDELELGIEDVFHYRGARGRKDGDGDEDEEKEPLLLEPDAPPKLLKEMADLLGVSPPLDVSEDRAILDELEYHLPGGEGEQARVLRKLIDGVKRRRNALMAKAGVGGKAYEAVEKRLIERLRNNSVVKILTEVVGYLAVLLSNKAGDRIAEAPSGALRACLASPPPRAPPRAVAAKGKRTTGGGGRPLVDRISLLACAGSTVIATRCPPDAPPPPEASSFELAKRILAIESALHDEDKDEDKDKDKDKDKEDAKKRRVVVTSHTHAHFKPRPEMADTSELGALWSHVRASQPDLDGIPVNPVSSCCSYDSANGIWSTVTDHGRPPRPDSKEHVFAATLADSISGIQPAAPLPASARASPATLRQPLVPVRCPAATLVDPLPLAPPPEVKNVKKGKKEDALDALDALNASLASLVALDPVLERELVPPGGGVDALIEETKMRVDGLLGKDDALAPGGTAVSEVRELLTSGVTTLPESAAILASFLRSELAPTLRKMSAPQITTALSQDHDVAKCAADLREPETRARLAALSDACVVSVSASASVSGGGGPLLSSVTSFVIWACSVAGKDLPQKSTEAAKHAADILVNRLASRLEFSRSDHRIEDTSKVKAVKEALRAANKAALEKLTDEDRELLRELKGAIRGTPDVPEAADMRTDKENAEALVEDPDLLRRGDKEVVQDASDAFF